MKHAKCYKKGYPRPRFVRENFTSLDGEWNFAFDDENAGSFRTELMAVDVCSANFI